MGKIIFPSNTGQHYYKSHYTYMLNLLKEAGAEIEFKPMPEIDNVRFAIQINGIDILIDFSDHLQLHPTTSNYKYCFKFHYDYYNTLPNIYPFSPISFMDWNNYKQGLENINYTCNTNLILNNQRAYAGAKQRRLNVQAILRNKYGKEVDFSITSKEEYWKKINNCLVSVHVPGARNDMLDRGQIQMMAFGVCTISPILRAVAPDFYKLQANIDYIPCKQDYLDLPEKIEWCKAHRKECIQIGQDAKKVFEYLYTPKNLLLWIYHIIGVEI